MRNVGEGRSGRNTGPSPRMRGEGGGSRMRGSLRLHSNLLLQSSQRLYQPLR